MKNLLWLISSTLIILSLFACTHSSSSNQLAESATGLNQAYEVESEIEFSARKRRVKIRLCHYGTPDPEHPNRCGNREGCSCPFGICATVTGIQVPSHYLPSPEDLENNLGVADVYVSLDLQQAKFDFLQTASLEDGTVPIDDVFPFQLIDDIEFGTTTFHVAPALYQANFDHNPHGTIIVDLIH